MNKKLHKLRVVLSFALAVCLALSLFGCYYYEEVSDSDVNSGNTSQTQDSLQNGQGADETSDNSSESSSKGTTKSTAVVGTSPNGSSSSSSGAKNLNLVEKGKANCTIVIAANASAKVKAAAEDLQNYISKITGATPAIGFDNKDRSSGNYILVGPSKYTQKIGIKTPKGYPGTEKIILKRKDNYLALLGNDDGAYTGTQFAVTAFLEELGCGWFGPDELWQIVPKLDSISVGSLDKTVTPKFNSRINNVYNNYKDIGMRWYLGGNQLMTGHGLPALVPKTTFNTHPEWFSLINGKRTNTATWWQYCYSNEEFAKEIGRKVIEYFDKNPYAVSYPITANDGWETDWCECSECSKYPTDGDLMLAFANRVAKVVAKKYPDRTLHILSYHSTYHIPQLNTKAEPNVEIMFCREASMTSPITKGYYKPGRNSITHNTYVRSWKDNFTGYIAKTGVKNISVWEWYCLAVEYEVWKDIPWVQGKVAIENQNYWKSQGADYVFYDQGPLPVYRESGVSFPLRWPLWYVAAKGMWDSSLTGDQILSQACDKLFGNAGPAMLKYYQALATASAECKGDSICWVPPAPSEMYTSAQIKKIDATVSAAEKMKPKISSDQRKRLENQLNYWKSAKKYF
ncbi:MAG: DUF4838 domain-containing protein [Oscillospiraceae bacterium]|nr:DUF4838 domain-containing protein [Oscillospiraceae bacterium]